MNAPFALKRLGGGPALAAGLLLLEACSVGAAPPAPAPAPAAATGVAAPAHACGLPRFEEDLLRRVNEFRALPRSCGSRGRFEAASPVRWSPPLTRQAFSHARDMSARNRVDHLDARGRGPAERATLDGYGWSVFAENIAGNYAGTAEVMAGWQASAGHCANLMSPSVTELGVACAPGVRGSAYKTYWAMELARPR
jgi:uncharacterized protein YkwD